ncbi:aminotransferase [Sedimentitalea sp. JM2-8]|uniref:aspartate transaminase n=1 Tax=Sedimentitalea xiamensis TaxID=3050037 RepID=A0ABT7FBN7_9RHOB|nr:aminotransferase [Sedimentitalea xiamensis]MDK3072480.1 aminotransferase [Sedimentitalea xiamensis]
MTRTRSTFQSPITETFGWLEGVTHPANRPLILVSQAAPVAPPPPALREALADLILTNDSAHFYGPVLGLPALREELAAGCSRRYGGSVSRTQVCITSGCNQAFAAALASLTDQGDEVILPTPWYFNHKMWLDMTGVRAVPLPVQTDMLPDPDQAAALITDRTRAIVLVSPNNPTGAEYPAGLLRAFFDLARSRGLKLLVDETYRDFDSRDGAPHDLFTDPDWDDTLVHLYSFSKAYRLTGHRVGALVAAPDLLEEAEKFLDTVTICPAQIGQHAALWGLRNLGDWLAGERDEILARRGAIRDGFPALAARGWSLKGLGAYFAYVQHPFDIPSDQLAKSLVRNAGILALPATMFAPAGDAAGQRHLRIAFANLDRPGIGTLFDRLADVTA